jgi:predicted  nucleic acid-binding Zn-ribbon protein
VETANELTRLLTLQHKAIENHIALEKEFTDLPAKMEQQKEFIRKCREDVDFIQTNFAVQDKQTRRQLRKLIFDGVSDNELATRETLLMTYQGFQVVLPTNMSMKKPFVWLQRQGRYYVELGDSEIGCLIRLDNALENLSQHLAKLEQTLTEMEQRQAALEIELQKTEDFVERIAACKEKLASLDHKLGVVKV